MKQVRVLLLPTEWDGSPLQGYPPALCRPGTHIYTWVERENMEQSFLFKETT